MSIEAEKIGFPIKNRPPRPDDHAKSYCQKKVYIHCFQAKNGQEPHCDVTLLRSIDRQSDDVTM